MKTRNLLVVALFSLTGLAGIVSAAAPLPPDKTVPLGEVTGPWLALLKSGDATVRNAAGMALVDIVRKYPAAAGDLVKSMAVEENGAVSAEHERLLVPLAKDSPATVSAFIRLIRDKDTNYRARNFGVKVLSQAGPAVATSEFVDALSETYCPVPGAFMRIMRALSKDAAPILATGYRHPDANVRNRSTMSLRVIGRTEPAIQKLFNDLQAEGGLLLKLRDGAPADRIAAIASLAEMARTTPGTGTLLVKFLKDVTNKEVLAEAESRLITLGGQSHEVVAALVAGVRSDDEYRLRVLAIKVLPKVGANLTCQEMVDALGDDSCPVPSAMNKILVTAGPDALPVLAMALTHPKPEVRSAAGFILQRIPRQPAAVSATPRP